MNSLVVNLLTAFDLFNDIKLRILLRAHSMYDEMDIDLFIFRCAAHRAPVGHLRPVCCQSDPPVLSCFQFSGQ